MKEQIKMIRLLSAFVGHT